MSFLFAPPVNPVGQTVGQQNYGGSSYGQNIPQVFGCCRIPANLIWLGTVNSVASSTGGGGKGGGAPDQTTTSYSASFAVELCANEIVGIAQIWLDSNIGYNATNLSLAADLTVAAQFLSYLSNYTGVHLGTLSQVPDPLMAQALAPGLPYSANAYVNYDNICPAYRGLAYIVFNNLPFGGGSSRVPSVEVEVCQGPNVSVITLGSGVRKIVRGAGCPANLIIEGILTGAGINLASVNIDSAINSILVPGLVVYGDKRKQALDNLMQAFDLGFCESGYSLDFFPLYRSTSVNIPFASISATVDGRKGSMKDPFPVVDLKETDLPFQVNVNFKNNGLILPENSLVYQTSYETCTQGYQRLYGRAQQVLDVDMNDYAMDVTTAIKIASKQLYRAWIERTTIAPISLDRTYINLEPNDIVSLPLPGVANSYRVTKTTLGKDYTVEVELIGYNISAATSRAVGATPWGAIGLQSPIGLRPILYPLNLPALQGLQASKPGFYVAAAWTGGQGQPGSIYATLDAWAHSTFEATVPAPALTGLVTGPILPNVDYYVLDTTSTLIVTLDNADSNSQILTVTADQIEAGANLFYVGNLTDSSAKPALQGEIIQALDVSFNTDRTVATFTNLYRGRKGTENFVGSHAIGDFFVFLSGPGIIFIPESQSWVGNTNFELELVPPGVTSDVSLAAFVPFVPNNNNMSPLSPTFFTGIQAVGDPYTVNFSWIRRTRYDSPLFQYGGVACGETVESYSLIIYNPSGIRVTVRKYSPPIQLLDPVLFTYTAAMRLEDFGSTTYNLTGYTARVAMLSTIANEGSPSLNSYAFTA